MIETSRFQLSNGLRVIHNYDPTTAMVAVVTLYDVGARDEDPALTGIAHLFEHLMFGGSINVADFDGELQRAGGVSNAWTSNDFTVFYDILPAQNIETALRLESDRMLMPALSDKAIDVQRSVVIEEFKQQCLNQPYGDRSHFLRKTAFTRHPYSWPVIGKEPSHVQNATKKEITDFFEKHYAPNNAVIAISGNVTAEEAARLIEKWYSEIPARQVARRNYPAEPPQTEARLVEAAGHVPSLSLTMAWKMDGYATLGYRAADTITDILANGNASRFYRDLLIGTNLFTEIDAAILGSEEPGLLLVNAKLTENSETALSKAVEAIDRQIDRLVNEDVSDYELQRVLNRMESNLTFNNISYLSKAIALAQHEYHGENINDAMKPYRQLTPADIRLEAKKIFDPSKQTRLIYRPS